MNEDMIQSGSSCFFHFRTLPLTPIIVASLEGGGRDERKSVVWAKNQLHYSPFCAWKSHCSLLSCTPENPLYSVGTTGFGKTFSYAEKELQGWGWTPRPDFFHLNCKLFFLKKKWGKIILLVFSTLYVALLAGKTIFVDIAKSWFSERKNSCVLGEKGGVKETKFREWYELRKWQKNHGGGVLLRQICSKASTAITIRKNWARESARAGERRKGPLKEIFHVAITEKLFQLLGHFSVYWGLRGSLYPFVLKMISYLSIRW